MGQGALSKPVVQWWLRLNSSRKPQLAVPCLLLMLNISLPVVMFTRARARSCFHIVQHVAWVCFSIPLEPFNST